MLLDAAMKNIPYILILQQLKVIILIFTLPQFYEVSNTILRILPHQVGSQSPIHHALCFS